MTTTMSVFVFWLIMYLFGSWLLAAFDRRSGKKWYRWFYNMTNESPLPENVENGFVAGRNTGQQFTAAIFTAAAFTLMVLFFTSVDMLTGLFLWLFGTLAVTFGFATGTFVANLWGRRSGVFAKVDEIQSGKINPMDAAAKVGGKALSQTKHFLRGLNLGGSSVESSATKEPINNGSEQPLAEEVPVMENPDDLMAPFLKRAERRRPNGESDSGL